MEWDVAFPYLPRIDHTASRGLTILGNHPSIIPSFCPPDVRNWWLVHRTESANVQAFCIHSDSLVPPFLISTCAFIVPLVRLDLECCLWIDGRHGEC